MSGNATYRGRFAPSPTGPLHFGSLVAALASWLDARHHDGAWLVRIEDIDPPRERSGAAMMQLRTLAAFGMQADEPVMWQSTRHSAYDAALATLRDADLLFECRCSRSDLATSNGVHLTCVDHPSGQHPALRLRALDEVVCFADRSRGPQRQRMGDEVGDVVLRRADGLYAYQLAVVVDDAEQGVTDVVRGADLLASTGRQIALQRTLGLPTPRYLHIPLALDANGEKLSKSQASLPLVDSDPMPALNAAWRFLQPAHASPDSAQLNAWLQQATARYLPSAIRLESAAAAPR